MKSKDVQNIVLSKRKNGEGPSKIFRDLNGAVALSTIKRWCQMISRTGTIDLSTSTGRPRTARTRNNIQKVKDRLKRKKPVSSRKLAIELATSASSIRRILKLDLKLKPYKKTVEPFLTDDHKAKRMQFSNWVRNNFCKEDTMRILFSDEKMFDIDGIYNVQNDRIWAVDRAEADVKGGRMRKRKFPQKVIVWLGVCSKGVSPLVIFEKGSVDHSRYIAEVLPIALAYGNKVFGNNWTFQQDGAMPHTHARTQQWCRDNFPAFIEKNRWPPNSPDINPLDYSIWDELAHSMNWSNVRSKKTLIKELKLSVKRIRQEVVLESCSSWTNRLYRLSQNGGNYLSQ